MSANEASQTLLNRIIYSVSQIICLLRITCQFISLYIT